MIVPFTTYDTLVRKKIHLIDYLTFLHGTYIPIIKCQIKLPIFSVLQINQVLKRKSSCKLNENL